jgi:DNA polymerase elongation subunit (family B)
MTKLNIDRIVPSALKNIVGLIRKKDGQTDFYQRTPQGVSVQTIQTPYWLLLNHPDLINGFSESHTIKELEGSHYFKQLVDFPDENTYKSALKFLKLSTGKNPSSNGAPYRVISDLEQQAFISTENRCFSGMTFEEIRRMQIDIETLTGEGYTFPNAEREEDAIILIAMRDNTGWEKMLALDELTEKQMLSQLVELIKQRDPDVIEGHNIFNFDLSYIEARAKRHRVKLNLGRDGSKMTNRKSRFTVAERTLDYNRFQIAGRHIIDTMHLAQQYDVIKREFSGFGLKYLANYFGVAASDRTYVEGDQITQIWLKDPQTIKRYCMDDVRETDAISKILSPSFFYQTQLTPLSYQNCITRGNATRIESIFTAAYLAEAHSIPQPEQSTTSLAGGLTASFHSGIFENIWHADVRSLYPSIIIADQLSPARDTLKIFQKFLSTLRLFRLEAKDLMNNASNNDEKEFYNAMQSTFKILINSFYGYLGFGYGSFNDYEVASKVTEKGREILTTMENFITSTGAKVIEMDTDGLYFQPPRGYKGSPSDMQQAIQNILPDGIEVELDSTYQAMFGYKAKNYALLHHDGRIALAGGALKSRGLEPFQRKFMMETISLLLHKQGEKIDELYKSFTQKIANQEFPLSDFVKSETLARSPKAYQEKLSSGKGRRAAAYELVLASNREYRQGDQVKFYVTGNKKKVAVVSNCQLYDPKNEIRNENILYYQQKLEDLLKKFSDFITVKKEDAQLELF